MKRSLTMLLLVLGLVATACGGDGDVNSGVASLAGTDAVAVNNADSGDESAVEVDQEQAMLDFAACMRDNGAEIEDPTVDSDGNTRFGGFRGAGDGEIDREAMQAAREACQSELDGVALGFGGRGDFDITELQDTMVEYAACMRDNGYDMDDPDLTNFGPGGSEGGGRPFGDIDRNDPDFIAAQEACQDILGGFRGPGTRLPGGNG